MKDYTSNNNLIVDIEWIWYLFTVFSRKCNVYNRGETIFAFFDLEEFHQTKTIAGILNLYIINQVLHVSILSQVQEFLECHINGWFAWMNIKISYAKKFQVPFFAFCGSFAIDTYAYACMYLMKHFLTHGKTRNGKLVIKENALDLAQDFLVGKWISQCFNDMIENKS